MESDVFIRSIRSTCLISLQVPPSFSPLATISSNCMLCETWQSSISRNIPWFVFNVALLLFFVFLKKLIDVPFLSSLTNHSVFQTRKFSQLTVLFCYCIFSQLNKFINSLEPYNYKPIKQIIVYWNCWFSQGFYWHQKPFLFHKFSPIVNLDYFRWLWDVIRHFHW